jgi:uncharacterized protein
MSGTTREPGFLGRGWSFPPAFEALPDGVIMADGEDHIKQSIRLILSITPGERQMLPDFGCNLARFAFEPIDLTVATKIESEVHQALLHYEPRIIVNEVSVVPGDDDGQRVILITIAYTVRANNRRDNLVFPYYGNERAGVPG